MQLKMNPKAILENWVSFITGVFGFGVSYTAINWSDALPKIIVAGLSAFVAGGLGIIGKWVVVWAWKEIKSVFKK